MSFRFGGDSYLRSVLAAAFAVALSLPAFGLDAPREPDPPGGVPAPMSANETAAGAEANRSAKARTGFLFAVVGQVARPGVYRAPVSQPFLEDLVHNAGGLTGAASGYLRLIRRGSEGFEARFATHPEVQLRPGDVVVAERKPSPTIEPRKAPPAPTETTAAERGTLPEQEYVQLAFVNLLDRPVVLKMVSSEATLERILELLGQRSDLASTVQVIPPADVPPPTAESPWLSSATVLVFDPSALDVERLPPLPRKIANDRAASDDESPATAHTGGEQTRLPGQARSDIEHRPPAIVPRDRQGPQLAPAPPFEAGPPKTGPELAPTLGTAATTSQQFPIPSPSLVGGTKSTPAERNATGTNSGKGADPFSTDVSPAPPESPQIGESGRSWFGEIGFASLSAGLIAVLAGVLLLFVRRAKSRLAPLPARSTSPINSAEAGHLDEIINNELLLVEEPVEFPKPLELFARPYGKPKARLDAEHGPRRPHFLSETPLPQRTSHAGPVPAASDTVDPPVGRERVRFDAGQATTTARQQPSTNRETSGGSAARSANGPGLLDRVLSNVQGAARP